MHAQRPAKASTGGYARANGKGNKAGSVDIQNVVV